MAKRIHGNGRAFVHSRIALTALTMRGDQVRCMEAGANDYLSKPVRLKGLARRIGEIVG